MKKILLLPVLAVVLLVAYAPAIYAADALYHFMHNDHDALILGQVQSVENGVCTIKVSETIVSPFVADNIPPVRLLEPQTVQIDTAGLSYFGHENRPPAQGDQVLVSVNRTAGDRYEVSNGAYLVSSLDKHDLSVLMAEDAPTGCLPAAAAVECFVHSGAKITTFLFYGDTAVAYYMGKDSAYDKCLLIYYRGYDEVSPLTPVPGCRLPDPGITPTFEAFDCP